MVRYSVEPIITFDGRITEREYMERLSNQVHPMIQTLFQKHNAVFQEDNDPIHTDGTVQSWYEEHEGELQSFPSPAQSPDLNITEKPWSGLETSLRNRFPNPTSLKQLEVVLQEELYKSRLETVQYFYESIPRRIATVLKAICVARPY
jgi:hypothetical protein